MIKRIVPIVLLCIPAVALAAPNTFKDLANVLVGLMNASVGLLVAAGLVIYLFGMSFNILEFGTNSKDKVKAYFFWGIIVITVMVSVWGLVALLQNTLFPKG